MMRQTFHHPLSGASCVLEYPLGWSKATHYSVTISQPGMKDRSDRHDFETPAAARAGAIEHQRLALADGWLMGAAPVMDVDRSVVTIYRDGQRIECDIVTCDVKMNGHISRQQAGHTVMQVVCDRPPVRIGDRIVVRREFRSVRSQWAMMVRLVAIAGDGRQWCIQGPMVATEPNDAADVDREQAIQRCVDVAMHEELAGSTEPVAMWAALAQAFPDASERQQAMERVVAVRQQRRDAAQRAEQQQRDDDRRRAAEQIMERARRERRPAARPAVPVVDPVEALLRLSGGQMPGAKHKRRINLGE